jgi:hypothetical protein
MYACRVHSDVIENELDVAVLGRFPNIWFVFNANGGGSLQSTRETGRRSRRRV